MKSTPNTEASGLKYESVVSSFDFERTKHKALFDLICNKENWKLPIDCWIPQNAFEEFNQAVVFFTAGFLYRTGETTAAGTMIRCKANGYYTDCGA